MNKNSLLYKIITSFTTILAVILIFGSIFLTFVYRSYFYSEKFEVMNKEAEILSSYVLEGLDTEDNNTDELEVKLKEFNFVSNIEVLICDNKGLVFAGTDSMRSTISNSKVNLDNENLELLERGEVINKGEIEGESKKEEVYLTPIMKDGSYSGVIIMMIPQEVASKALSGGYKVIWICTLVILIIALLCINFFTKRQLINPLKEIYLVANKLARGDVDQRIPVKSSDEIGELAKSFNLMAESLEAVDSNRRDFISNVSHELRSPITSMKGFIAGMLDGVIPKDKENYYLKLVYDEINRLSRLVNDLLDISSMEVGKFKLTIMEVDINAIVKRCLLNLESKVNNKGIRINATLENEHLYVYADSDRIMQVLTNLLDNAIKYGRQDGIIDVSTRIKGPKVHISVYNNGAMMSEEEMAHIWDRFYKSDKSRTNKESTGLGLPIVRLIMTQHKEDVWVRNEREGVVFTFTLAKV